MSKRPAFQFYPGDWRTDPGLRLCSLTARGLWIEMMAIMHEGEPYGHLTAQGRPITDDMLARLVGEAPAAIKRAMKDLEANGVYSRTDGGIIFSRRMVRDEEIREARGSGGVLGKEHGSKGASHGSKGGRPRKQKPPLDDSERGVEKPAPSSSSSTPSPNNDDVDDEARAIDAVELAQELTRIGGVRHLEPARMLQNVETVREWLALGVEPDDLVTVIRQVVSAASTPIHSLKYFDGAVRQMLAKKENSHGPAGSDPVAGAGFDNELARAVLADEARRRGEFVN